MFGKKGKIITGIYFGLCIALIFLGVANTDWSLLEQTPASEPLPLATQPWILLIFCSMGGILLGVIGLGVVSFAFKRRGEKINAGLNTPEKIYLESAEVHYKRGEEALARNDLDKAILEFKYVIIAQPQHEKALAHLRGKRLGPLNTKRTTRGVALFDEGEASLKRGDYNRAILLFTNAINVCPVAAVASFGFRGKALLMASKYKEAIDDFSIAVQYTPKVAEYYFNRGHAYLKLGKKSEARKDFKKTLELNPGYEHAREMLKELGGKRKD